MLRLLAQGPLAQRLFAQLARPAWTWLLASLILLGALLALLVLLLCLLLALLIETRALFGLGSASVGRCQWYRAPGAGLGQGRQHGHSRLA